MPDFKQFANEFHTAFKHLSKVPLFTSDIDGMDLWNQYLDSFPAGTNEIYRIRRYYDGSYDRNVIRRLGNLVGFIDGTQRSVWDMIVLSHIDPVFQTVVGHLSGVMAGAQPTGLFRIKETKLGYISTTERLDSGSIKTWNHFHADIPSGFVSRSPGEDMGAAATAVGVYRRGLTEIDPGVLDTVLDLIAAKQLYRGEEFKPSLLKFQKAQEEFFSLPDDIKMNRWLWENYNNRFLGIRNTAIGTLLVDLSEGKGIEASVASFEAKVAPMNYRRTTALITPRMIQEAEKTVEALGLASALERRLARTEDILVTDVLWANRDTAKKMKGVLTEALSDVAQAPVTLSGKPQDISIADFMEKVVPKASKMEILFEGRLQSNLVSITAPVHADAGSLFKWDNGFGWSYNGEVTDAIRERVKAAGGNVNARLRVSLSWFNHDDLDLHSQSMHGHVYYGQKLGILDVDMNVTPQSRSPVENQAFTEVRNGQYKFWVDQYTKRESKDVGFDIQLQFDQQVWHASHSMALRACEEAEVVTLNIKDGKITAMKWGDGMSLTPTSKNAWGLNTETFIPVNTLMLSPNHWGKNQIGNKHWFFLVKGCENPDQARGFYNEFLHDGLLRDRKVFEVLGGKMKCPKATADKQLSGFGFSSTRNDTATIKVTSLKSTTLYNVKF